MFHDFSINQWIGLRDNLQETIDFPNQQWFMVFHGQMPRPPAVSHGPSTESLVHRPHGRQG